MDIGGRGLEATVRAHMGLGLIDAAILGYLLVEMFIGHYYFI